VLCHPDPDQVGTEMETPPLERLPGDLEGTQDQSLTRRKAQVGLLHNQDFGGSTHILYQQPIPGTDWIVAVHANFDLIRGRLAQLRKTILQAMIPTLVGIVLLGTLVARLAERQYERRIERANADLERQVVERTAELQKAAIRYRNLFEGAAGAIFLIDTRGTITEVNRRAEEITGLSRPTLCGELFENVCAKLSREPMFCTVTPGTNKRQCVWEARLKTSGP